jgi:2',3'-cyclic-nucleotide 2'-phosphodiesterase
MKQSDFFTLGFFGDVVGRVGRDALTKRVCEIRKEHDLDMVIANGENSAGGLGIDIKTAEEIFASGVDVITTGNHIWKKKEINKYLVSNKSRILRPMNFAPGAPGEGSLIWVSKKGVRVCVINLMGRVYMEQLLDCPFQIISRFFEEKSKEEFDLSVIDFHAEATSEKVAFAYHVDGKASLVVGTHTHVQTADEQVLPKGTAYITDVGMCGPAQSVIGVNTENIVERFVTGRPTKFEVAKSNGMINAVVVKFSIDDFRVQSLFRINERLTAI